MSIPIFPSRTETERALDHLKACEKAFEEAIAFHENEKKHGGERLVAAATRLAHATRTYRKALLDPRLPPV